MLARDKHLAYQSGDTITSEKDLQNWSLVSEGVNEVTDDGREHPVAPVLQSLNKKGTNHGQVKSWGNVLERLSFIEQGPRTKPQPSI